MSGRLARAGALGLAVGVAGLVAAVTASCSDAAEAPASAPSAVSGERAAADGEVVLATAARESAGIELAPLEAARGGGELEAYGRVLDPVPLAEAVFARDLARSAEDAARREYERVKALHRQDENASTRELETARVSYRRARLDRAGAEARLVAAWGHELAGRTDLDEFVRRLGEQRIALARVDLPALASGSGGAGSDAAVATELPTAARVTAAASERPPVAAEIVGPTPTTDPALQGRGFFLLVESGPTRPGTALVARLAFAERVVAGVRIPRAAVLWDGEGALAWVAKGDGRFERRRIVLHGPLDGDWLATGDLAPGEQVVVSGAALLLSLQATGGPAAD